ncbi:MAG TPA: bifunctional UDP-N-acetylglucosamine diphosphorylase/glucosamine-1-phosphate N-acetyltransferase GlmU [Candidatus Dormibacteraeota bacterium]|nr:bifunctional UDP-N-acetylglucosamine diphosphorylase/glucosamine-1-phosphate N-acetyltransferase GlmU [Candidatus Dormibacteraeota bacterium]
MNQLTAIILAAGEAKRMRSARPKVLHALCGRPLIAYPVGAARAVGARVVVVVGRAAEEVRASVAPEAAATFVEQKERLGTGHAVLQTHVACGDAAGTVLVLPGDVPLLSEATLRRLVEHHVASHAAATLLTAEVADPTGYGRVVREQGRPTGIVEHRDATAAQREIREIGTSVYCFDARRFWPALAQVTPDNAQHEYYLTDVIGILHRQGERLEAVITDDPSECLGVNDRSQLAELGGIMRRRILDRLMAAGVTVIDPATTYVDDTVTIGMDTVLHPNVSLTGRTVVGAECVVSAGCQVTDTTIADGVLLKPYCVLAESTVETGAHLGPFCHLRPLSHVGANAKIGNFVELKKSKIGRGSKVPHLSYVGDTQMGEGVNVGAGTITCNYDGAKKHETVIGDGAFVGTNSSLVAPLTIGEGAYVAAGSVITKNVPPGSLAVARGRQETREGWVSRKHKDMKAKHGE